MYKISNMKDVIFVTDDIACKMIARKIFNLTVRGINDEQVDDYHGFTERMLSESDMAYFYEHLQENVYDLLDNEYLILKDSNNAVVDVLVWRDNSYQNLKFPTIKSDYFGIVKPLKGDIYQQMALNSFTYNQITRDSYKEKQSKGTKNRWENGFFDEVHCKSVICLETGVVYKSITEANNITNICRGDIGKCCLKQMKTANGYHWQYYDEKLKNKENRINLINKIGNGRGIKVWCIETNMLYGSIKEASIDIGIDNSSIGKVIKGKQMTAGGFHWKIA